MAKLRYISTLEATYIEEIFTVNTKIKRVRVRQQQAPSPSSPFQLDKVGLGIFLYAYAVLLGAAYLFGFWRPIGFDIFPYLSIQNYVSAPLNRVVVLIATPLVLATIFAGKSDASNDTNSRKISLYLIFLYCVAFSNELLRGISQYMQFDFHFDNERNVIAIATIIFIASLIITYQIFRYSTTIHLKIFALILIQTAVSMSAGYRDGKIIYNGAVQVHLLANKELCESENPRDWVYLGKFSEQAFFMNTIDKRLCITASKEYKLVSRKFKEKL